MPRVCEMQSDVGECSLTLSLSEDEMSSKWLADVSCEYEMMNV